MQWPKTCTNLKENWADETFIYVLCVQRQGVSPRRMFSDWNSVLKFFMSIYQCFIKTKWIKIKHKTKQKKQAKMEAKHKTKQNKQKWKQNQHFTSKQKFKQYKQNINKQTKSNPSFCLQAGGMERRYPPPPQGGVGIPQHPAVAQCPPHVRAGSDQHCSTPTAPHQVLHHHLQVSAHRAQSESHHSLCDNAPVTQTPR